MCGGNGQQGVAAHQILELGREFLVIIELVQLRGAVLVHPQRHGGSQCSVRATQSIPVILRILFCSVLFCSVLFCSFLRAFC